MQAKTCAECNIEPNAGTAVCCSESGMIKCSTPESFLGQLAVMVPFIGGYLKPLAEMVPVLGGGGRPVVNPEQVSAGVSGAMDLNSACRAVSPSLSGDPGTANPWFQPPATPPQAGFGSPKRSRHRH